MIKYLKKLWKRCFSSMGDSRIKNTPTATPVIIKHTPTDLPIVLVKPLHCGTHARFKKSCSSCQEAIK